MMKEVFAHPDSTRVGYCRSLLEGAGIPCFIRNEHSNHFFTAIPVPAFYPTLCVNNDEDLGNALSLVASALSPADPDGSDWQCPMCDETVPPGFDICWNCESGKPLKKS